MGQSSIPRSSSLLEQTLASFATLKDQGNSPCRLPVVYTAVIGPYDVIRPPRVVVPGWRYIAITDDQSIHVPYPWERQSVERFEQDPKRESGRIKTNPFKLFPQASTVIWVDGNIELLVSPEVIIERLLPTDSSVGAFLHPRRNCIYREADVVIRSGLDDSCVVHDQMRRFERDGYPEAYGLCESRVVAYKKSKVTDQFCSEWYAQIKNGSRRDQLSANYAAWKVGLRIAMAETVESPSSHWLVRVHKHNHMKQSGSRTLDVEICDAEYSLPADVIHPLDQGARDYADQYDVKYRISKALNPSRIVEIGVRAGYSAYSFLQGAPKALYKGFDANNGSHGGARPPGMLEDWTDHAKRILNDYSVDITELDTQNIRHLPASGDLVHVDGDHTTPGVMHDLDLAWSALEPNGVIVVDDYDYLGEVRRGVLSWLARHHSIVEARYVNGFRGDVLICRRNDQAAVMKLDRIKDAMPLLRTKAGQVLIAGPHIGEFGHELFCWQGRLRWLACQYDATYVMCHEGHEALYEDFATVNRFKTTGLSSGYRNESVDVLPANTELVKYRPDWSEKNLLAQGFFDQAFTYPSGPESLKNYDLLIHARARSFREEANWPLDSWMSLLSMLDGLKIAVVGLPGKSLSLAGSGACNLQGISLQEFASLCRGHAKLIVGTSSGPMHFASLCGCPQVVFTPDSNRNRYKRHWNPWGVPVDIVRGGWKPLPNEVVDSIRCMLATS